VLEFVSTACKNKSVNAHSVIIKLFTAFYEVKFNVFMLFISGQHNTNTGYNAQQQAIMGLNALIQQTQPGFNAPNQQRPGVMPGNKITDKFE